MSRSLWKMFHVVDGESPNSADDWKHLGLLSHFRVQRISLTCLSYCIKQRKCGTKSINDSSDGLFRRTTMGAIKITKSSIGCGNWRPIFEVNLDNLAALLNREIIIANSFGSSIMLKKHPVYSIIDLKGEPISGRFYTNELQKSYCYWRTKSFLQHY